MEAAGLVYATGLGVPRDVAKARQYFAEADRLGSDSLDRLSSNARDWRQVGELARRAVERLPALAGGGDAAAAELLARLHQLGRLGVPFDSQRAVQLATPAAARGDALAMRVLFYAYLDGTGVAHDEAEALRWLRRGADAGNSYCMMFLSQRLRDGDGVPRDVAQSLTWLERAATAGNYRALLSIARAYAGGWQGLPRDPDKALPWMRKLAAQGDFEARGWLVVHGHPVQEMRALEE